MRQFCRRSVSGLALAGLTVMLTGCYSVSYERDSVTNSQYQAAYGQRLAMGDTIGMSAWTPVIEQRMAMARARYLARAATASAPAD